MDREYKLLKVGSDAEFFVLQNAVPTPICGRIGGTKAEPRPVLSGNGFAVQEDNVALEFNIPPASSAREFADSIVTMLAYLKGELAKQDLVAEYRSEENFLQADLKKHLEAYHFGCEPDYCVWTRTVNPTPTYDPYMVVNPLSKEKETVESRNAGFHIHVSYLVNGESSSLEDKEWFVKAQDLFLGVPLTSLEMRQHNRNILHRRRYYGCAGAFRPKEYGHEYRVLGSSALTPNLELNEWIFQQNQVAIAFLNNKTNVEEIFRDHHEYIVTAINRYSSDHIQHLMRHFGIRLP